jgi:hypothetical protein
MTESAAGIEETVLDEGARRSREWMSSMKRSCRVRQRKKGSSQQTSPSLIGPL